MRKLIIPALVLSILSNAYVVVRTQTGGELENCQSITNCVKANCCSGGCNVDISWTKCPPEVQGYRSDACIPSSDCSKRNCTCTCNKTGSQFDGYSISWNDCSGALVIAGGSCRGCGGGSSSCTICFQDSECDPILCPPGFQFYCEPSLNECRVWSPIVIDIEGNGFNLTDGAGGVAFDLVGNGIRRHIAWTSANSDDAWLVLDRDGDGKIDSRSEEHTSELQSPTNLV